MKRSRLAALLITMLVAPGSPASGGTDISGYYKNYSTAIDRPDMRNDFLPDETTVGAVSNRVRFNLVGRPHPRLTLNLSYDFSPRVQDQVLFTESDLDLGIGSSVYRAVDIDRRLYPDEDEPVGSFAIFQNLDRAYAAIETGPADFYVGRQAIAWGSARVINPTDVLAPFMFNELDIEDRIGVDAVRMRVPMGFMGEIDAGWAFGDDFEFENSALFLRSKFYWRRNDVALMAVAFRENLMTGIDLTRAIGGAGFWLEAGYVFTDAFDSDRRDADQDYLRASVGMDYSLRDGTYLFAEYHFNDAGSGDADDYVDALASIAYREGAVYLLGRHYLTPGVVYQITPLLILSAEVLVNLNDGSFFTLPRLEYNIAEDIYLSGGAYVGVGSGPYLVTDQLVPLRLKLDTEFGAYPDSYFASFRVYF
ncbi:MAG: hypothetical protein JSW34_10180 [Candidatus Zixiibacteriota bacterium]|nr:MAG: hypothetical protein JSW34_10180 [candidate division Zixibacteria bacterium]